MSSAPRPLDDDFEIHRLSDDPTDDDDVNAAPTKVGPMSKAFVDQMMFKAQLAETSGLASRPPTSSAVASRPPTSSAVPSRPPTDESPQSGRRSRARNADVLDEPARATPALPPPSIVAEAPPPQVHARDHGQGSTTPVSSPPEPAEPMWTGSSIRDATLSPNRSLALEVGCVLAVLAATIAGVVHFVFP